MRGMESEIETIGIVCDGQLGRMETEAAIRLGFKVVVLGENGDNSPAAQVGARQIHGSIHDPEALQRLIDQTDVVTWETEHCNALYLATAASRGANIQPWPGSLVIIQDKLTQCDHLVRNGLPVAPYAELNSAQDFNMARVLLGRDMLVKARTGGFDGRGNLDLLADHDWESITKHFTDEKTGQRPELYAEQRIDFQRELAVIGVRDLAGRVALYPVVQTIHARNICQEVIAPAPIDPRVAAAAEEIGRAVIGSFEGAGVFAVELFQDTEDRILVNETAPRVHNSGHWTRTGAKTSQFENHVRAITGMPIGSTEMVAPVAVMVNILGRRPGKVSRQDLAVSGGAGTEVMWYGKDPKEDRKIGDIVVTGDEVEEVRAKAWAIRGKIAA